MSKNRIANAQYEPVLVANEDENFFIYMIADSHTGKYYHIYNHANENLFREDKNYMYFLKQWQKYICPVADVPAYCLMPNHFHFLIKVHAEDKLEDYFKENIKPILSKNPRHLQGFENLEDVKRNRIIQQFSTLFNSYSKAFNKMYNRRGNLFCSRFKKKEITSEDYLTNIIFYIHHNPVHHGFTDDLADWPHSSYLLLLHDEPSILDRELVIEWFGNEKAFRSFHTNNATELNEIQKYLSI